MGKLRELTIKVSQFVDNLSAILDYAVQSSDNELVFLNKQQMLQSKLSDDTSILPEYSASYAAFKGFSKPDLKLTGDFQSEMFLIADNGQFQIASTDYKTPLLVNKYSENIFGIAPSNTEKAKAITTQKIAIEFKKITGL